MRQWQEWNRAGRCGGKHCIHAYMATPLLGTSLPYSSQLLLTQAYPTAAHSGLPHNISYSRKCSEGKMFGLVPFVLVIFIRLINPYGCVYLNTCAGCKLPNMEVLE